MIGQYRVTTWCIRRRTIGCEDDSRLIWKCNKGSIKIIIHIICDLINLVLVDFVKKNVGLAVKDPAKQKRVRIKHELQTLKLVKVCEFLVHSFELSNQVIYEQID